MINGNMLLLKISAPDNITAHIAYYICGTTHFSLNEKLCLQQQTFISSTYNMMTEAETDFTDLAGCSLSVNSCKVILIRTWQ